jgi:hypothetical protein
MIQFRSFVRFVFTKLDKFCKMCYFVGDERDAHRRLQSVSSGERGARRCAELWCGTATVGIVPP